MIIPRRVQVDHPAIHYDAELLRKVDIEKYLFWVFSTKSIAKESKRRDVTLLMSGNEKTFANYRKAIAEVSTRVTYWKEPTKYEREMFPSWRKDEFDLEKKKFDSELEGNPMPLDFVKNVEINALLTFFNNAYGELMNKIFHRILTDDYFALARFCGRLDFIKYLDQLGTPKKQEGGSNQKAWIGSEAAKRELVIGLQNADLIASGIEPGGIFSEKIKWKGTNTLLYYLIQTLQEKKLLSAKRTLNQLLNSYFTDKNGDSFNSNSANTAKARRYTPRNNKTIDFIVNGLSDKVRTK